MYIVGRTHEWKSLAAFNLFLWIHLSIGLNQILHIPLLKARTLTERRLQKGENSSGRLETLVSMSSPSKCATPPNEALSVPVSNLARPLIIYMATAHLIPRRWAVPKLAANQILNAGWQTSSSKCRFGNLRYPALLFPGKNQHLYHRFMDPAEVCKAPSLLASPDHHSSKKKAHTRKSPSSAKNRKADDVEVGPRVHRHAKLPQIKYTIKRTPEPGYLPDDHFRTLGLQSWSGPRKELFRELNICLDYWPPTFSDRLFVQAMAQRWLSCQVCKSHALNSTRFELFDYVRSIKMAPHKSLLEPRTGTDSFGRPALYGTDFSQGNCNRPSETQRRCGLRGKSKDFDALTRMGLHARAALLDLVKRHVSSRDQRILNRFRQCASLCWVPETRWGVDDVMGFTKNAFDCLF
ncbi:hypothetical protein M427DRAFT_48340 [Gonapodya prolifera JEL478]|uniref:Uncharacterized protein n=1 Tax=Gonapodya prolifera (strain JEL478) TaxID=1344416 RepID=A0A139A119_GONPJ|nr:hypothetical protein M427DRAFT_48340 [Gonapodya prolifera JEL478]|eukprot:KXS10424.1 hypothetical protein M427DRAFT_48340 [Gonapodya prolifera JEL478]